MPNGIGRRSNDGTRNDQIEIITELLNGEAMNIISSATKIAIAINDWRTQAVLEFEKGMWLNYVMMKDNMSPLVYNSSSAEDCFTEGFSILKKPKHTLAFLYHLILMELGKIYVYKQDWGQARQYLKECYRHCKQLVHVLQLDEESLQRCTTEGADCCTMVEIRILTTKEQGRVARALMMDYKVLTSRSMWIAEQLSELSLEQITKWTAHFYSTSWRSRHHNLTGKLRRIKEKHVENHTLIAELVEIEELVDRWSGEDIEYLKTNRIDLINEAMATVNTSIFVREFKSRILFNTNQKSKIYIKFNIEVLRIIIENIVSNIHEVGFRLGKDWTATISFNITNDVVSILFSDNLGKFSEFSAIVDLINNFNVPLSSKRAAHGTGLILIKKLIRDVSNHRKNWTLVQDKEWKTLWIPLTKVCRDIFD